MDLDEYPLPTPTPSTNYLPLITRNWSPPSPIHHLDDAPDDCPGYAVEIGHSYRDDWDQSNDNDWYSFPATADQPYTIQTFDLDDCADTIIALYDQNCTTLLEENDDIDWQNGDVASRIVWTAPAEGTYHVMVRSYDFAIYGSDTGYTFDVTSRQAPAALSEPGKSPPPPTPTPTPTPTPKPTSPPTAAPDSTSGDTIHADHPPYRSRHVTIAGRPPGPQAPPAQQPTPPPTKPPAPPTPTPKPPPPPTPTSPQPGPQSSTPTPMPILPAAGGHSPTVGLTLILAGLAFVIVGVVRRRAA